MRYASAFIIGALTLAAGSWQRAIAGDDDDGAPAARWVAVELNGKAVEGPTLDYTSDKASGTGGCNRFNGPISIEDDAVQIGPLASTRMTCEGKAETETQYFAALEAARSFVLDRDSLVLKDEDGHVLVKFKK
jgi:heat shock protein HslJ